MKKLTLSTNYSDLSGADLIIESVKEDLAVKEDIFLQLNKVCSKEAIIVSNTSCLPVTELAGIISNPSRIAGLHFSNPADKMLFAEIIKTKYTSQKTIDYLVKLTTELGKKPIISDDTPGFIANRILFPYLLEAVRFYEKGVSKEFIDNGIKSAYNHPLGPLKVIDFMGLDTFYLISNYLYEATNEQQFMVPEIIKKMIQANFLGCKSGEGFYKY